MLMPGLDGIEVLDDGTFIVSDFFGHRVWTISPDRKEATALMEIDSPADIGLDTRRGRVLIPLFRADEVLIHPVVR